MGVQQQGNIEDIDRIIVFLTQQDKINNYIKDKIEKHLKSWEKHLLYHSLTSSWIVKQQY